MNNTANFVTIMNKLIDTEFANKAEASGLIVRKPATVASYDKETNTATVYFQGDNTVESLPYKNRTGQLLSKGDKVCLFYPYGNPTGGWIMIHTNTGQPMGDSGLTYDIIKEVL